MATRPQLPRTAYAIAALLLALSGCGQDSSTGPSIGPPAYGKVSGRGGKTSITVSAADPDTIPIDATLTVRILGSGFAPGATVEYLLGSTPTTKVRATSVSFVSSTELSTTTVVERDAVLGSYDIAVTSGGKRGVGVEKVEVVVRPIDLPEAGGASSSASDVNDSGVIVGTSGGFAIRWTPSGGSGATSWQAEILGAGRAIAINSNGDVLSSQSDGSVSHTWIHLREGGAVDLGPGSYGVDISDDRTVLGWQSPEAGQLSLKVLWRSNDQWKVPVEIPVPEGYFREDVYAISPNGRLISGVLRKVDDPAFEWGAVWAWDGGHFSGPTLVANDLPGAGRAVTNSGALAGWWFPCTDYSCASQAAFWVAAGSPRQPLPEQPANAIHGSAFNDINAADWMVGRGNVALHTKGKVHYAREQPILWAPGLPGPIALSALQGLRSGEAMAINNSSLAVGFERDAQGRQHAVAWLLP